MITLRIMLRDNESDPNFNKVYLDTLPSVPRVGEKLTFGVECFVVCDVLYNVPMKTISVVASKTGESCLPN